MNKPALIETLRVHTDGSLPLLPWHLQRLQRSCEFLGYPLNVPAWLDLLHKHLALHPQQERRVRMLHHASGESTVQSSPLSQLTLPLVLLLAPEPLPADSYLSHKTTHRPWFAQAQHYLEAHPHYFDIIYCDAQGWVLEGSRSTIYIQDTQGRWLTPPVRTDAILPGVQRAALLEQGQVVEQAFNLEQLRQASKVRISNALRGWQDARLAQD